MPTRFAPVPSRPNCVSSRADPADRRHHVAPLPPTDAATLIAALRTLGDVRIVEASDTYVHAVCTTRWCRFRDDVEFELEPDATHVRSASRVGFSDLGVNRRRVERLRRLLVRPRGSGRFG